MGSTWSTGLASIHPIAGARATGRSRKTSGNCYRSRPSFGRHVGLVEHQCGPAYQQELCRCADSDAEAAVRHARLVGIVAGAAVCEAWKKGTQTPRPARRIDRRDQRRSVCASPQAVADFVLDQSADGAGRAVRGEASPVCRLEELSLADARRFAVGAVSLETLGRPLWHIQKRQSGPQAPSADVDAGVGPVAFALALRTGSLERTRAI